jgi:hypothetical protein
MNITVRSLGIALATALVATTAMTPLASAQEWRHAPVRVGHAPIERGPIERIRGGHGDAAAWLGLGIAAVAGAAIIANATAPQPVYAPPTYVQPSYAVPAYVQSGPTCTTINGYAACIGPDGTWQYVR